MGKKRKKSGGRPFIIKDGKKYVLADEETEQIPAQPRAFQRLSAPPRNAGLSAKILLLFWNGSAPFFGWFFVCFGMLFVCVFFPIGIHFGLLALRYRHFEPAGQGEVISVEATKTTVNGARIHKITFQSPDGSTDFCYTTGKQYQDRQKVALEKCGDKVRIVGTSITSVPLWGGLPLCFMPILFPTIGLCLVGSGTRQGLKALRLLQEGEAGRARFVDMNSTGIQVNNQPIMKLHYRFAADGKFYDAYAKVLNTQKLTDDAFEPLLYDAMNPKNSVLLDTLPTGIRYDELSQTFTANPLRAVLPTFFCLLFVAEIAVFAFTVAFGGLLPLE